MSYPWLSPLHILEALDASLIEIGKRGSECIISRAWAKEKNIADKLQVDA